MEKNEINKNRFKKKFSMGQTALGLTCSIMEKPLTGLDESPRILLLCFRARNSDGDSHAGHMILTVDGGRLSGTVVDPVGLNHKCRRRHVPGYKFCPSDIGECACEFDQTTICSDKVWVILNSRNLDNED